MYDRQGALVHSDNKVVRGVQFYSSLFEFPELSAVPGGEGSFSLSSSSPPSPPSSPPSSSIVSWSPDGEVCVEVLHTDNIHQLTQETSRE